MLCFLKNHIGEIILFVIALSLLCRIIYLYIQDWKKLPPGPWGLPILGYIPFLGNDPHVTLTRLKEKYGDVIGIKLGWKYAIVLNEYSVFKDALSHPASFDKPNLFGSVKTGIGAANGQEWSEQRNYVLYIMRRLGLGKGPWENLAKELAGDFVKILQRYEGKPVDIATELQKVLASIIMSFLYGRKFQLETNKNKIETSAEFSNMGIKYYGPCAPATLIPGFHRFCEILNIGGYRKSANATKRFFDMSKKEIEKQEITQDFESYEDYITMYKAKLIEMRNLKTNHFFNDENIIGNANAVFLGSSDLTTSSLKTLFRLMASHPDIQLKVQEELDEMIGRNGSVSYSDKQNIPYTFAVLLEAQRFISVVPLSTTRQLSADMELRGYRLPKGTWLIGNIYALHNDTNYWKNPEIYQPERFLTEDKKVVKNRESFMAFSVGKRNCPGESISWIVILAIFAKVMQHYSIRLPRGQQAIFETEGCIISHLKPQPLCFIER